ncbi:uncharacterized protein LOC130969588 isoform X3 [Arachis stenosperma]|uniref:uncharacterized protein LOC130969588 isoform X3 n=1 Tax=Arachis stenosperma TaxID=217475 RepID=UPI0025ACFDB5|nr:uncharacterized protein LOC130969588 isoform X3 [Arachis stenosperma]
MPPLKLHNLKFQVGDSLESKSFQRGYRGAWFRCKIREIRQKNDMVTYLLEYIDYPDQKPIWTKIYQKGPTSISKSKRSNMELMVRPSFPTIYRESEKPDISAISGVIIIVDNTWKVGDLVDWWKDDCYWSGRVTKILRNDQIDLLPVPFGEGMSDVASSRDLRPSLDWCPEKGWTVPMPTLQEGGHGRVCAEIVNPPSTGINIHASDGAVEVGQPAVRTYSSHSSQNSIVKRKQFDTTGNRTEIDEIDSKIRKTCFSDSISSSHSMDASIGNTERIPTNGESNNHEYPSKKMRSSDSLGLNCMSSNTIEAAVLDLEELVNRIKWLRGILNFGIPSSCTKQPSWEFSQHHAT